MAGILPFGAVFIELFFILTVCRPSIALILLILIFCLRDILTFV
jgi:hypothetical protein